jgi:hypothetical protein
MLLTIMFVSSHAAWATDPTAWQHIVWDEGARPRVADSTPAARDADHDWVAPDRANGYFFKDLLHDYKLVFTAPADWGPSQWSRAGITLALTAGLMTQDNGIERFVQRHKSPFTHTLSNIGSDVATPQIIMPALGGLYLYGKFADDDRARETALLSTESFVIANTLTEMVKLASHRARPDFGPAGDFRGPSLSMNDNFLSFASGHATSAFSVASVIASEYHDVKWAAPLAYSHERPHLLFAPRSAPALGVGRILRLGHRLLHRHGRGALAPSEAPPRPAQGSLHARPRHRGRRLRSVPHVTFLNIETIVLTTFYISSNIEI